MKILVALKRVADPDNANKVKIPASGEKIETTGLEWKPNPFDEYALEAALRLTEDGKAPKVRAGEVVVVTFGPKEAEQTLRAALATGADKAFRVDVTDDKLDGDLVARALKTLVEREKPDVVVMGKQAVDGDSNQVGQILAELLDWPMATFAATLQEEAGALLVGREVDGGVATLRVKLPAVVTVDLRIVAPTSVYSLKTGAHLQVQRRRALRGAAGDHGGEEEAAHRAEARGPRGRHRAQGPLRLVPGASGAQGGHQGQGCRRARHASQGRGEGPVAPGKKRKSHG